MAHIPGSITREKSSKDSGREFVKDRQFKSEPGQFVQRRERVRDDPHALSVVDLTQDTKTDEDRQTLTQHSPSADVKSKYPSQPLLGNSRSSSGTHARFPSSEQDKRERDEENGRHAVSYSTEKPKRYDASYANPSCHQSSSAPFPPRLVSSATYPPPHHMPPGLYPLYSSPKEHAKEHRVTAPTYVPSVEVYDERKGPIQIASQARDNKTEKNRDTHRAHQQFGGEKTPASPGYSESKRDVLREEGSVIRTNSAALKRPLSSDVAVIKSSHSPNSRELPSSKHTIKISLEQEAWGLECENSQRSGPSSFSMESNALHSAETKWKPPFEISNYATSHMAALAAQHAQAPRGEDEGKRMYSDRRSSPGNLHDREHNEVSAMQSLIKYSGNFSGEMISKHGTDSRTPFGGLGSLKLEAAHHANSKAQYLLGKQLKREPERPESAKSFSRDGSASQGEGEVRHPPVGIAVAVARRRDNNKLSSVSERDRPILGGGIKGK